MLDTISINIFIFNRKIREKTQLPLPILFFPLLPFSLGTHLLLAARPCTRSSLPARARLSAARPCALGRLGAGRGHPSGRGQQCPSSQGGRTLTGQASGAPSGQASGVRSAGRRPLRQRWRWKSLLHDSSAIFFQRTMLICHGFLTGKILVIFPELD